MRFASMFASFATTRHVLVPKVTSFCASERSAARRVASVHTRIFAEPRLCACTANGAAIKQTVTNASRIVLVSDIPASGGCEMPQMGQSHGQLTAHSSQVTAHREGGPVSFQL